MRVFPNGTGLLVGLLTTLALALFFPWREGEINYSNFITTSTIFLIFLIQGWNLQIQRLGLVFKDFRNLFRVHGLIFFAPLTLVFIAVEFNLIPQQWQAGLLFLSILPTTISSCVVYTYLSDGDSATALVHATVSNLMAMVWVPFAWVIFGKEIEGAWIECTVQVGLEIFPEIALHIILPCFLGWIIKSAFIKRKVLYLDDWLKKVSFVGILVLVYFAFSKSINVYGFSESISLMSCLIPYLLCFLICHLLISGVGVFVTNNEKEVKIAEFFCISQKSLAMGLPLLALISVSDFTTDCLIAYPLIIYHFLQLCFGICFIPRFKKWVLNKSS